MVFSGAKQIQVRADALLRDALEAVGGENEAWGRGECPTDAGDGLQSLLLGVYQAICLEDKVHSCGMRLLASFLTQPVPLAWRKEETSLQETGNSNRSCEPISSSGC